MGELGIMRVNANAREMADVVAARAWLAQVQNVEQVKDLRDKAFGLAAFSRKKDAARAEAVEFDKVVVWADRRLGELTRQLPKAPDGKRRGVSESQTATQKKTALAEQKIPKQDTSVYEAASRIPEVDFARILDSWPPTKRVTTRVVVKLWKESLSEPVSVEEPTKETEPNGKRASDPGRGGPGVAKLSHDARILPLLREGHSIAEVVRRIGCDRRTVKEAGRRAGWNFDASRTPPAALAREIEKIEVWTDALSDLASEEFEGDSDDRASAIAALNRLIVEARSVIKHLGGQRK